MSCAEGRSELTPNDCSKREALATPAERAVCKRSSDFIDKDCGGDSSWCIDGDPPKFCPDCGLPVEVAP